MKAAIYIFLLFLTFSFSVIADNDSSPAKDEIVVDGAVGLHICGTDFLHLDDVYENTPAWNAGIRKGDLLVSVDGYPVQNMKVSEIGEMIRGKSGTKVVIEVQQASTHERKTFELIRAVIRIPTK